MAYSRNQDSILLLTFITNVWNQRGGGLLTSCRYQIVTLYRTGGGTGVQFYACNAVKTNKQTDFCFFYHDHCHDNDYHHNHSRKSFFILRTVCACDADKQTIR